MRSVRMPERIAASSLPPTENTRRPKVVRVRRNVRISAKATMIQIELKMPRNRPRPSQMNSSIRAEISRPSEITTAIPLKIKLVAMVARKECTLSRVMAMPFTMPKASPMKGARNSPR